MRSILAAALLFASLAGCDRLAAPPPAQAEYRPGEAGTVDHAMCLLGFTAVPLKELATGHHLVDATMNGRKATFVLDTGANVSVVDSAAAAKLGLPERGMPAGAFGLGGGMKARQVKLESLAIGPVRIRRSQVMTSDLGAIVKVLAPLSRGTISGIIGQDAMKEHRAVIDVARPILYLMAADADPAPVPADRCRAKAEADEPKRKSARR
jgi:clan AA aspartic protease (TIGR02281 family)